MFSRVKRNDEYYTKKESLIVLYTIYTLVGVALTHSTFAIK